MKVKEESGGHAAESSGTVVTVGLQTSNQDNMGPTSCQCQTNMTQDLQAETSVVHNDAGQKSKMTTEKRENVQISKEVNSCSQKSEESVTQKDKRNHSNPTKTEDKKHELVEKNVNSKDTKDKNLNMEKLVADMKNVNLGKDEVQKVSDNLKDLSLASKCEKTERGVASKCEKTERGLEDKAGESDEGSRVSRGPGIASTYMSHQSGQQYFVKGYYPSPESTADQFQHLLCPPQLPNYAHLDGNQCSEFTPGRKKRSADSDYVNMSKGFRVHQAYPNQPVENEEFSSQMRNDSTASLSRLSGGSVMYNQLPNHLGQPGPRANFTHHAHPGLSNDGLASDSSQDSWVDDLLDSVGKGTGASDRELMQSGYGGNDLNYQSPVQAIHYSQNNMNINPENGDRFARPSCMYENQNSGPPMTSVPSSVYDQEVLPPTNNLHSSPVGSVNSVASGNSISPYAAQSPGYQQANSPVATYHPVPSPPDGTSGHSMTAASPASVGSHRSSLNSVPSPAQSSYSVPSPGMVSSPPQPGNITKSVNQVYSPPQLQGGSPYQNTGTYPIQMTGGSPGNGSSYSSYSSASSGYATVGPQHQYPPVASPDFSQMSPGSVQSTPSPATSQRHTSTSSTPPPELDNNFNSTWDDLQDFIEDDIKEMEEEKNRRSQRTNSNDSYVPCSVSSGAPATAQVPTPVSQQQQLPVVIIPPNNGNAPVSKRGNTAKTTSAAPLTTTIVVPSTATGTPQMILVMSPPRPDPNRLRPILPKPDPAKSSSKGNTSKSSSKIPSTGGPMHAGPPHGGGVQKSGGNRQSAPSGKISVAPPQCRPPAMFPREYPEQELAQARRQVNELQHGTLSTRDDEGDGLLHMVVVKRKEVYLKALLERLQRNNMLEIVNQMNDLSQTPVYLATRTNEPAMLHMLLLHGGDPNHQARLNTCSSGHLQMRAPIHYSASCGDDCLETLEVLLHCPRLDINQMSTEGMTALHYAAAKHGTVKQDTGTTIDSTQVIIRLIQFGGDLDKKDGKSGKTPIHYIIETKDLDLIKTVFDMVPADQLSKMLKTTTFDGNTSLHIAAGLHMSNIEEHKRLIRILKQNGGDVSIMNGEKKTAKSMVPDNKKEIIDILKGQEDTKTKRNSNTNRTLQQNPGHLPGQQPLYIFGTVQSSPMTLVPGATPAQVTPVQQPHSMPSMPPLQPPSMPQPALNMPGMM